MEVAACSLDRPSPRRVHAAGRENTSHHAPITTNEARSASGAESPSDSREATSVVAKMRASPPPRYPAANPAAESRSAAGPAAIRGRRLPVKTWAMSKPTAASTIAAATASRAVGGTAARSRLAPAPQAVAIISHRLWAWVRSAWAERNGVRTADASMAVAMSHAQTTPPGTPQAASANTTRST